VEALQPNPNLKDRQGSCPMEAAERGQDLGVEVGGRMQSVVA
jgi:hypothetical protein